MNYTELSDLYRRKARGYSIETCRAAVIDIDETLDLYRDRPLSDPYVTKLWAERDAMCERLHGAAR